MTEKMIPLSIIDARIKELEARKKQAFDEHETGIIQDGITMLEEIKKEATFVQEPLEQKILQRIKELENAIVAGTSNFVTKDGIEWSKELHQTRLDELRKL